MLLKLLGSKDPKLVAVATAVYRHISLVNDIPTDDNMVLLNGAWAVGSRLLREKEKDAHIE
jgi:hypothetical protein